MPEPKLLAFDTSTDVLSVAVRHGDRIVAHSGAGGAQASSTLIPLIRRLLAEAGVTLAELDAIAFGRGPGSFTGLRTACAVAQGLGFGAGVPLLPIDTLQAVADEARHRFGVVRVVALLDARMDQVYAAHYAFDGDSAAVPALLAPEQVDVPDGWALAGNAFAAYGERLPSGTARHAVLPTAEALLRLAPALLAAGGSVAPADAWPLYVRDKVAQTTEERAALKAAAASAATL
ncbi:tRNA (adenosine(37)-N6)-threonylcarbamoyltransferase complex dimerization subunit type 1 TsaB [Variovorax arabinosiphilus]|uniref:tRNA (adenosine(37)-N6)-threonylcarbamoyltransferase complex dimerization subunit type 1 TsaB n=1 Tax=Variovorax arabinosiphilus TaxID=3053498 RepID=UPI002578452B|nr:MULTISPECIES: tRNA (adenosine(37)-N6)-threonylcarbamoyltransferase complex dimerization subunit type 1 TsaB [unclassified Variovorax]MDM0121858.1 tRNA (adenosine(37)-N6)-threonylcarbamoyltransferase complex dimerization subunit type 1 TsaB [Variovorax sp. J2L1-78]MDM0131612.1 tRNA (adenosine(37)-N6)-threonylcarbamoyltransferase complex dimerization subunit type 1 TsaB [Variovorax sp. J2L1-63]MDM0234621.1 tRNA (adenosine(37)-N6)-threonylcarbamoyltransferase complex dimerization subunit type 1 